MKRMNTNKFWYRFLPCFMISLIVILLLHWIPTTILQVNAVGDSSSDSVEEIVEEATSYLGTETEIEEEATTNSPAETESAGEATSDSPAETEEISQAESTAGTIEGIIVTPLVGGKYNGSEQELVSISGTHEGDRIFYSKDKNKWNEECPKGKDAGKYPVYIKVERDGYDDYYSEQLTAAISAAEQEIKFENLPDSYSWNGTDGTIEFSVDCDTADDKERKIEYGVLNITEGDTTKPEDIAEISEKGELTIKKGGCIIKVTATVAGDKNYREASCEQILAIKNIEEDLLSFESSSISYVLGTNNNTVSTQQAGKKYGGDDTGGITYTAEIDNVPINGGLTIDLNGTLEVSSEVELGKLLEEKNDRLTVKVTASKGAGEKGVVESEKTGQESYEVYDGAKAEYEITIQFADSPEPENAYTIEGAKNNEWYCSEKINIKPADGDNYLIARQLEDENKDFEFKEQVVFEAGEQVVLNSEGKYEGSIYLKKQKGDGIGAIARIPISFQMDSTAPTDVSIQYNESKSIHKYSDEVIEEETVYYYGSGGVTVEFRATDVTSGVESFDWVYVDENGKEVKNNTGSVKAVADTKNEYTATITILKGKGELKGRLKVTAIDKAGNSSENLDRTKKLVIDTTKPEVTVEYDGQESEYKKENENRYFLGESIIYTFTVKEKNFFWDDIHILVSKNGGEFSEKKIEWKNSKSDTHTAILPLSGDGEYKVAINYKGDPSGNEMKTDYQPKTMIIDGTAPEITAEYTKPNQTVQKEGKSYYSKTIQATFTIKEKNFDSTRVNATLYRDNKKEKKQPTWEWKKVKGKDDEYTATITISAKKNNSKDGDYYIKVKCTDKSKNQKSYTTGTVVIDTKKPVILVSYENENVKLKKYYNETQTATVKIKEHNYFDPEKVNFIIHKKDITGAELKAKNLIRKSSWENNGDTHTMTITYPGDANYSFDIEYTDIAGNKAKDYPTDYFTVDTTKPTDFTISYSTSIVELLLSNVAYGFYDAKVTVTITATDTISGVHEFQYNYVNADGVSEVNSGLTEQTIGEVGITYSEDRTTATAVFEIPKSALGDTNQFNGTVNFNTADRSGNISDYLRDTKRIVVDNISPTSFVEYNVPVLKENSVSYYAGNVAVALTINEANFYSEDVKILVTKNGKSYEVVPSWTDDSTDIHIGHFSLIEDGDYFITVNYADKSKNQMQTYASEQITIDTEIAEAFITVNGEEADGRAFKEDVVLGVSFEDKNFDSYEMTLTRTSYADKGIDVSERFLGNGVTLKKNGGSGEFDTFEKIKENDGIYTITVSMKDKSGHIAEKSETFTINRYGSVYEYSDYLVSLIQDDGAYVQNIEEDLVITEYNADRLVSGSLSIEILKDGQPVGIPEYDTSPEINENTVLGNSGWYQYQYTIHKSNFEKDGVYKIVVASKDATGNTPENLPENTNYEGNAILFRVDSTAPEINSIKGLEKSIINATGVTVDYTAYDTFGLKSIVVYVDGKPMEAYDSFEDENNFSGQFTLKEKASSQKVRIVVTDLAENVTDTDSEDFKSAFSFHSPVTVSTNIWVRWYANKKLFWGMIAIAVLLVVTITGIIILVKRWKRKQ